MIRVRDNAPDPDDACFDEHYPLGDGKASSSATVVCPHCGEAIEIALDAGSGSTQEYVEDCEVCCQPWQVRVAYAADGEAEVIVTALDG